MSKIIDFEERSGSIKNLAITRRFAAEFVGPISNKISDHCVMDPAHYPDSSLEEYLKSAGYSTDSLIPKAIDERI